QLALNFATHALQCTRGNNSFWSAADAHEQVDGVGILCSSDGTGNVAVHDEAYLGAGFTDFRDQIIVAWAVKNDHGYFLRANRSEEHTSELQSRFDLVCRLLLEKKKTQSRYTGG